MDEIALEYGALTNDITTGDPRPKYPMVISSVAGKEVISDEMSKGAYWVRNLVSPVRFSDALANLCLSQNLDTNGHGPVVTDMLEIGPHSTLKWPIKDTLASLERNDTTTYDSLLKRGVSALISSFSAIGRLHCRGFVVNVPAINRSIGGQKTPRILAELPEYPFNHTQLYWFESRLSKNSRFRKHPRHELLGTQAPDMSRFESRWRHMIRESENPWILDHKVRLLQLSRIATDLPR